jgi:ribonuclease P protein component
VRREGKSYAHPLVVLQTLEAGEPHVHVGIAATRSIGNAVRRNYAKRRLRAAITPLIPSITPGWDIVLIARPAILNAPFAEIHAGVSTLLKKAGLIRITNVD